MKKVLMSVLLTMLAVPIMVSAQENSFYYTNMNGANLTKEQYDRLITVFSEDTIYTMTPEAINLVKDDMNLKLETIQKYIRIDEYYDEDGNLIDKVETEVSEEEALNFDKEEVSTYGWHVTHQTNMKSLRMQVVSNNYPSIKIVTLTNTWLSIPSTKSFDVIALRPGSSAATITVDPSTISGYQKWDGNYVNYNANSSNTKRTSSFTGNGGIGISMNIVDNVQSSLENSMTVYFISDAAPFNIYGTYQHAQSDVTLAQSQDYTFSSNGLGNVLNFSSSVRSKYDGMSGVFLSYSFGDELYG